MKGIHIIPLTFEQKYVKEILKGCQQRLDDHNAKHELNPYDNRKAGQKLTEVIDLAVLVPSGEDVK